jgi:hypothetical protein
MKKLLLLFTILIMVGCTSEPKVKYSPSFKDDPVVKKLEEKKRLRLGRTMAERDSMLKDWPFPGANGEWIPSRDGIENSDTVVNGFPYNRVI